MNDFVCLQISRLCPEEAAAQEQTGQVEECLKVNLLKIKQEPCKKVKKPMLVLGNFNGNITTWS